MGALAGYAPQLKVTPTSPCMPPHSVRNLFSRSEPVRVAFERHAELVVVHTQIAVAIARDRFRYDLLHLLGHDADIGLVAAVVAEAIEAQAVVETAEQRDVVLEHDVGPAPAT